MLDWLIQTVTIVMAHPYTLAFRDWFRDWSGLLAFIGGIGAWWWRQTSEARTAAKLALERSDQAREEARARSEQIERDQEARHAATLTAMESLNTSLHRDIMRLTRRVTHLQHRVGQLTRTMRENSVPIPEPINGDDDEDEEI